jgi:hypothetical protein
MQPQLVGCRIRLSRQWLLPLLPDTHHVVDPNWQLGGEDATKKEIVPGWAVADSCSAKGCKAGVPTVLAAERLCVLHYTLFVEQECAEIRRETALGNASHERQLEFIEKIAKHGDSLVHVATGGFTMSDEIKARILSTLLTLMNCRENMDRAAMRQSALRRFVG